jgi:hypothetical protein
VNSNLYSNINVIEIYVEKTQSKLSTVEILNIDKSTLENTSKEDFIKFLNLINPKDL